MKISQITVFLENRAGQLAEITAELDANDINMRAINIAETAEYGLARIVADESEKAVQILRDKGFAAMLTDVVAIGVPHRPGGLNDILQIIAAAGIDIEYMYSLIGEQDGIAYMVFRTKDADMLQKVLADKGIF